MKSIFKFSIYFKSDYVDGCVFLHFMLVKWSPILYQDMGVVQMYGMGGLK